MFAPLKKLSLGLFGKLYLTIAVASVALIWLVMVLSEFTETQFSTIASQHQQQLQAYADQAEVLVLSEDSEALHAWVAGVEKQEGTWLGIVSPNPNWLAGELDYDLIDGKQNFIIGRHIEWPIHLYHDYNPLLRMELGDSGYSLMIQLPQRMRPGAYWNLLNTMITMGLPILLVAALSYIIYRNIIFPLQQLQQATQRFSNGDYQVRMGRGLTKRQDELAELAISFDKMADRIGNLLTTQRQLIQDISHELRTPITRIKLVLSKPNTPEVIRRVEQEINAMQSLMEDTLTLSWLDTEKPTLDQETVDVTLLLEAIMEDARFEFPQHRLTLMTPDTCPLEDTNHRALGQALENMIRNALKYSQAGSEVMVIVQRDSVADELSISVEDQGPGVATEDLENIFKPFFRADKSRNKAANNANLKDDEQVADPGGFGLGLALSKRQITALGGNVVAVNLQPQGLRMLTRLPLQRS